MNWIERIKKGEKFKDKFGNCYYLEHRSTAGLFGNEKGTYHLKSSEMDKSRGECLFSDTQINVNSRILGREVWNVITENKIKFINE